MQRVTKDVVLDREVVEFTIAAMRLIRRLAAEERGKVPPALTDAVEGWGVVQAKAELVQATFSAALRLTATVPENPEGEG